MNDESDNSENPESARDKAWLKFEFASGGMSISKVWEWPTIRDLLMDLLDDYAMPIHPDTPLNGKDITEMEQQRDRLDMGRQREAAAGLWKDHRELALRYAEVLRHVTKPVAMSKVAKWTAFLEEIDRLEKEAAEVSGETPSSAEAKTGNATPAVDDPFCHSYKEAAKYAGVSERTVATWMKMKDSTGNPMLPGAKTTGRMVSIPKTDLDRWRKQAKPRTKQSSKKSVKRKH